MSLFPPPLIISSVVYLPHLEGPFPAHCEMGRKYLFRKCIHCLGIHPTPFAIWVHTYMGLHINPKGISTTSYTSTVPIVEALYNATSSRLHKTIVECYPRLDSHHAQPLTCSSHKLHPQSLGKQCLAFHNQCVFILLRPFKGAECPNGFLGQLQLEVLK